MIPAAAFSNLPATETKGQLEPEPVIRRKVPPELEARLTSRPDNDLAEVIVVFEEDMRIPAMPLLDPSQPRTSPHNAAVLGEIENTIAAIKSQRSTRQGPQRDMLSRDFGGVVRDTFWLINGMVVELPLNAIRGLAQRPDVVSVEPRQTSSPPGNHGTADHVSDARARIDTDWYFDQNLSGGYIGLLDTGVRSTHALLSNPSNLFYVLDCTGGDTIGCDALPNPQDNFWNHGVAEAAIVTGNGNMNNPYRGVTAITLDSFKVWGTSLDVAAVVTGTQQAINVGDRVIFNAIQDPSTPDGTLSLTSDAAFDSNKIVLSIAGNFGPGTGSVRAPGNAHKVLAVGATHVVTDNLENYSGRGPTTDGRFKPDITLPTCTLTASNASDTATRTFCGTSGAVPYAAGAAMLYSNWYSRSGAFDAGHVYALMIAAGGNTSTTNAYDNNLGAGRLRTLYDGYLNWWKTSVVNRQNVDLTFTINTSRRKLKAALWWPETAAQIHNDVDLALINPSGVAVASSSGGQGVFEKLNFSSSTDLPKGTWRLRVIGFSVSTTSQTAYAVVHQGS